MAGGWRSIFLAAAVAAVGPPALANVFASAGGGDPRALVSRDTLPPVGAVGVVDQAGRVHRSGTGFMVGPCHMMTAHHAAGPQLKARTDLRFFVGGGDAGYKLTLVAAGDGVVGSGGDWALLRVADCPGLKPEVGWMEVDTRPWAQQIGSQVEAASLPFSAPADRLTHEARCTVRAASPQQRLVGSDCSATGGASGAPLYRREPSGLAVALAMVTAVSTPTEGVLAQWDITHATLAVPVWAALSSDGAALAVLTEDWSKASNPLPRTPQRPAATP